MDFSEALKRLKADNQVTRDVWLPHHFVGLQRGYPKGVGINANTAKAIGLAEGIERVVPPYLVWSDERSIVPWIPNQNDLFAEDWKLY